MRFIKYILSIACFLFCLPTTVKATHIYGADFYYQHVSGNTYKLTLEMYGDCSGGAFPNLPTSVAKVDLYDDADTAPYNSSYYLQVTGPGVEVSPVCASELHNTVCNDPNGTLPGVMRFIYSTIITLPHASSKWRFRFTGNMGNSTAGRSGTITNIVDPSNSTMNLEATLNNSNGLSNNSPKFTTIPTPFYCVNIPQNYNQGAIDSDGDFLVYSLAPALEVTTPVTYVSGFSAAFPLATNGAFAFDTSTGQLTFTPNTIQRSVVVNKVTEYRNGVVVGTATREMSFIVTSNCTGNPPVGYIDTTAGASSGGRPISPTVFVVCYGSGSTAQFNIKPTDPESDTINVTANGLPTGATIAVANNNTKHPIVTFSWNTTGVAAGNYTFFLTYKDFGCPISYQQTIAYTIRVVRPIGSISAPATICTIDTATIISTSTTGTGSNVSYQWTWNGANYVSGAGKGPYHVKWDTPGVKTISVTVFENQCPSIGTQQVIVRPTPKAIFTLPFNACLYDTLSLQYNTNTLLGEQYTWTFDGATIVHGSGGGPYRLNWPTVGNKHLTLTVTADGCTDTSSLNITVHPTPDAHIINTVSKVCLADKVYLQATGGVSYMWSPESTLFYDPDGTLYTRIMEPTKYVVTVKNEYGCINKDSIYYGEIIPCCHFAYPDAFSPNNDGLNEKYRVITYGNQIEFEFSIYNRWGERVYYSFDPKAGWDGIYNGKPAPIGTYFYMVHSKCYTGYEEIHKGDFQLLR